MRTRLSSSSLILALSCSALLVAACGGTERNTGGSKPKNTNNNTNNNSNNNNTGDCAANPNNCAPNELVGAAPACTCLNVCSTGYVWNPTTLVCDPVNGNNNNNNNTNNNTNNNQNNNNANNNTNNNQNNNNTNNNNNNNNGMNCTMDSDCPTGGDLCIQPSGMTCGGAMDCVCATPCMPNQAATGCDAGEACFWLTGGGAAEGLCVPDQGGQAHGQACNAMFDPGGNYQGDNCATNHYCWGAAADAPTGTCARLCPPNDTVVCPALGNFACDTSVTSDGSLGLCFAPPPAVTDDGAACMSGADCTASGRCIPEIGNLCGASCDGLNVCGTDALCLNFGPPVNATCVQECTMGGTPVCAGRNPNNTCHSFSGGAQTFGVCFPHCQNVLMGQCFGQGQTCNTTTGECS